MKKNKQDKAPKQSGITRVPIRLADEKHPVPKPTEGKLGHLITFPSGRRVVITPTPKGLHFRSEVEKIAFQPLNLFQK